MTKPQEFVGHSKWSEVRREVTPERRERIDAIKAEMDRAEGQAARETLRPDPLTPEDAIDALLALLPGTLGHDRDILAAAENIATVALRAATPDPAEPGLRETLRAAVRESEQRGYATVTVARDDLAALLATPDPAEPCSECDAGAATEHPHTPDRAASTVEPGLRNRIIVATASVLRDYTPDIGSTDRARMSEAVADRALTPDETA